MNKFFGDPRLCPSGLELTDTPVGAVCVHCLETIKEGESGFEISPGQAFHRACFVRGIVGSVAHQKGTCSCCSPGSSEGDSPELTAREAAEAAFVFFLQTEAMKEKDEQCLMH